MTNRIETTMSTRFPSLLRLATAALALVFLASACGDDGDSFTADAFGGGASFCVSLVDAIDSGTERTAPTEEDFDRTIGLLNAAGATMPSDAPEGIGQFIRSLLTVVEANKTAYGTGETIDLDTPGVADAVDTISGLDYDELAAWLQNECADAEGVDPLVLDGLSDTPDFSAGGSRDIPGPESDEIIDMDEVETTTTTTTIPARTIDLSDSGGSSTYLATTIEVESVTATNAHPEDFMADLPPEEGVNYLLVSIYAETDGTFNSFSADNFRLTDPDGRPTSGEILIDERGAATSPSLEQIDSETFVVGFRTDELITELDGWELRLDRQGRVPAELSLTEPTSSPYPIALDADAAAVTVLATSGLNSCDPNPIDMMLLDATVTLEADTGNGLRRANAGDRYVTLSMTGTSSASASGGVCDDAIAIFNYEFLLRADDRPIAAGPIGAPFSYMQPGESREFALVFGIPSDTEQLVLVGQADEVVAEWDVSLPPVAGE